MDIDKKPAQEDVGDALSVAEGQMAAANGKPKPESLCQYSDHEIDGLIKKLVRKIDFFILPPIGILYILNYIDRQNLSAAKLQGIMEM